MLPETESVLERASGDVPNTDAASFLATAFCRTECKSLGNRREFVATPDPLLTEAVDEYPSHSRHERAATGEEDSIYFASLDAGAF